MDGRQGDHSTSDALPTFVLNNEPPPHDPDILPHLYPAVEIERLFPTIGAAAQQRNVDDYMGETATEGGLEGENSSGRRAVATAKGPSLSTRR